MFSLLSCTHEIHKVLIYKFTFISIKLHIYINKRFIIFILIKASRKNKIDIPHSKVKQFYFTIIAKKMQHFFLFKAFDKFALCIIFKDNYL